MSENPIVTLTPKAHETATRLMSGEQEGVLRIGVRGGGCSGYSYLLTLDHPKDDDIRYEQEGLPIAIAADSAHLLRGSTLDYKDSFEASGFEFDNPNATGGCGCGSSFRVDDQQGCDSETGVGELDGIYAG